MVTASPLPATGPVSWNAFRISFPSVAARMPTTASPPTRPKRRETKDLICVDSSRCKYNPHITNDIRLLVQLKWPTKHTVVRQHDKQ